jgi:hypothetical protein
MEGLVKVVEAYCDLFLGSMMREVRIAVRQHCLLKFPGHFQILLKGFILFAQFFCQCRESCVESAAFKCHYCRAQKRSQRGAAWGLQNNRARDCVARLA